MRLLCGEMLAGLVRWLRAAGHDAALAEPGAPDAVLAAQALREGRLLVTKDRTLAALAGEQGVLLTGDGIDAEARSLTAQTELDWSLAPFTRCVVDNTSLRPATADEIARMPKESQQRPGPFNACPACGRLYWPGSHVRRMAERLRRIGSVPADEAGAGAGE